MAVREILRMGDARLTLEKLAPENYDVIILDAFSSDAIPVHLLTLEAFDHYQRHLKPDGAIAVHVSNRYLDLHPVVYRIADKIGFPAITIDDNDTAYEDAGFYGSDWIIMTRNQVLLQQPLLAGEQGLPIGGAGHAAAGAGAHGDDQADDDSEEEDEQGRERENESAKI